CRTASTPTIPSRTSWPMRAPTGRVSTPRGRAASPGPRASRTDRSATQEGAHRDEVAELVVVGPPAGSTVGAGRGHRTGGDAGEPQHVVGELGADAPRARPPGVLVRGRGDRAEVLRCGEHRGGDHVRLE